MAKNEQILNPLIKFCVCVFLLLFAWEWHFNQTWICHSADFHGLLDAFDIYFIIGKFFRRLTYL